MINESIPCDASGHPLSNFGTSQIDRKIPDGILRSQAAFRRELPELLRLKSPHRQWATYHGDRRIGLARTQRELVNECVRQGLNDDEYDVLLIDPASALGEEEIDIDPSLLTDAKAECLETTHPRDRMS